MKIKFKKSTLYIQWFNDIRFKLIPNFRYKKGCYSGISIYFGKYVFRVDYVIKRQYRLFGRVPKYGSKWIGNKLFKNKQ